MCRGEENQRQGGGKNQKRLKNIHPCRIINSIFPLSFPFQHIETIEADIIRDFRSLANDQHSVGLGTELVGAPVGGRRRQKSLFLHFLHHFGFVK